MLLGLGAGIPMPSGVGATMDGPFSPLDLSPVLWLDAADTSTITESGGRVSQWDDKSGNGNHVVQGTAARQPSSGIATINGLNTISNNGSNYLASPSISVSGCVVFAAYRHTTDTGMMTGDATTYLGLFQSGSTNSTDANFGTTAYAVDGVALSPKQRGALYTAVASQTTIMRATSSQSHDHVFTPMAWSYVASYISTGDLGEYLVVSGTLSADQIAATESYLAAKWNVTLA